MKKSILRFTALCLSVFALTSCGEKSVWESAESFEEGGKLRVTATTTMIQDLVSVIGGDEVEIYGMMADGIDPHSYTQRASDVTAMTTADLIFYNGIHLEATLQEKLENLENAHVITKQMTGSDLVNPEEENSKYADPHVWGDPILWTKSIPVVVDALSAKDPVNKDKYSSRGAAYREELMALHTWAKSRISEIPADQRYLVTSHDAFMYFSRAFDIEVRAIDGLAPGDKSGPKKVEELVQFIKEKKIKMIFPESAANSKGINAIAQDAETAVSSHELFADACGKKGEMETANGETYDVGTYTGMIKHNVNAVVDGLK